VRRAIGKGLSHLIAEHSESPATEAAIDRILPNARQPRLRFDDAALNELAASIKSVGVLQPLVVRPAVDGRYELIAGERRLRASKLAGLKVVPISIRSATNESSLELALIENIQREDINAMECAKAYRLLIDEFGLTQEQVATKVGKSRVAITNTLRLLKLPERIRNSVEEGVISEGHARALLGFESEAHMLAVFDQVLKNGLTVKDVESKASGLGRQSKSKGTKKDKQAPDPNDVALESALATFLGAPLKISRGKSGGELTIKFYSDDDLDRILEGLGFRL
jgi:ParB family chromosome partitioning protein